MRSATDWIDDGLCAQIGDDELWFPAKGGTSRPAKAVCRRCPVREACLEHALDDPSLVGIWGGTSDRERQKIRQSERTAA